MRVNDEDLIRAKHYGQRPHLPHQQTGHVTHPTNAHLVQITKDLVESMRPQMRSYPFANVLLSAPRQTQRIS